MPRTVRDSKLETREARTRLKPRVHCYWRGVEAGVHVGYRKLRGKSGTWWVRHYLGNGEYDVEPLGAADDLSDADGVAVRSYWQIVERARERLVARAHSAAGKTTRLTVAAAVESYLEFLEGNRKSVVDARHRANAFILPTLGSIEVEKLTTDVLRRWHVGLTKLAPRARTKPGGKQQHRAFDGKDEDAVRARRASANRVLTILKAALNFAYNDGKVASDGEWRKTKPFRAVDAARVRYLTVAEAQRLINGCDVEFRPLAQAALQTGCRYGELTRLQVHDFNPDSGTLAIRQSKSGKPRHVILTDEGVELFKQWCAGRAGSELILRRANGEPWRASHQGRPMRDASERAKISPPINFHALRHTWASLAVMAGVPLLNVSRNLGHRDTRMAEAHYLHLGPSHEAEAIRAGAPRFGTVESSNVVPLAR